MTYNPEADIWWITDPNGEKIQSLKTSDLRVSLVWRSVCFKTENEMENWDPKKSKINGTEILMELEKDLRAQGKIGVNEPRPENVDFAILLIDEYVKYPIDNWKNTWIPLNYCTLPELFRDRSILYGFLTKFFGLFC